MNKFHRNQPGRCSSALLFVTCLLVLAGACQNQDAAAGEAQARIAAARQQAENLTKTGASAPNLAEAMHLLIFAADDPEAAMALYARNADLLADNQEARVYQATAECMQAGRVQEDADKLQWLRRGMRSFDEALRTWPESEMVYLYQATTYASFPAVVGAWGDVLVTLDQMAERYASGQWRLEGSRAQLQEIYRQLLANNPGAKSQGAIKEHGQKFMERLPALTDWQGLKDVLDV